MWHRDDDGFAENTQIFDSVAGDYTLPNYDDVKSFSEAPTTCSVVRECALRVRDEAASLTHEAIMSLLLCFRDFGLAR